MVDGFASIKSTLAQFFAAIMAFVTIITGGGFGKLCVEVPDEVYTWSDELVYEVVNGTGTSVNFAENFELEKKNGDEWVKLEKIGGIKEIAYVIKPMSKLTLTIGLEDMFGHKLEEGQYRLTVDFYNGKSSTATFKVASLILESK